MAPEVLAKGVAYDSSADWFSFGCMIFKLLKGFEILKKRDFKLFVIFNIVNLKKKKAQSVQTT